MYIPLIYILFAAEATIIFVLISIILGVMLYHKSRHKPTATIDVTNEQKVITLGSSYIESLDHELIKNTTQTSIRINSENTDEQAQKANNTNSALLKIRESFLKLERSSAEHAGNDIIFWEKILTGLNILALALADHFRTAASVTTAITNNTAAPKEKVFYVETQGRKINGEVNRLKDILFDQENTLSDLMKSLKKAEATQSDTESNIAMIELRAQLGHFDLQMRDAKTCMDVLEIENQRLQEEINKLQAEKTASENSTDMQSIRDTLEKQKDQISSLNQTIDDLKLTTEQTEKIKNTLKDFAHSSQEMMTCITILEEENERLATLVGDKDDGTNAGTAAGDSAEMKTQIKKLEEELIKRDVAYAKLQDEFSSVEKEYLAMYNAMHGDNS